MPVELLEILKNGGAALAPLLGFLWWLERTDKKSAEANNAALSREMLEHIVEQKMLSKNLLTIFGKQAP